MRGLRFTLGLVITGCIASLGFAAALPQRYLLAGTLQGDAVQLELTLNLTEDITLASSGRASARLIGEDRELTGRVRNGNVELNGSGLKLTGKLPEQYDEGPQAFRGNLTNGEAFSLSIIASYLERRTAQGPFIAVASETPNFATAPWKRVNGTLERFVQTPATQFLREARALSSSGDLDAFYTYENRLEVAHMSDKLLSVLESQFFYTGGAHPNTTYRSQIFYASGGAVKRLTLQDIFSGEVPDTLLGEVTARLKRQRASMILDGSVKLKLRDLSVFNLTERGLVLTFAPYAVATYAEGAFTVTIPYEKLSGQLNPDFLP